MMRFSFRAALAPLLCLLPVLHAQETGDGLLRVDWQPGKSYLWETTTEAVTKATGKEQKLTVTQHTEMDVTPLPDGGKQVRVTFTRIQGKMQGEGGKAEFDTEKPWESDHDLREAVGKNLGKSFILVYDAKNKFVDSKAIDQNTGLAYDAPALASLVELKSVANLFRKSMEMGLPPMPVKSGDSWSADETVTFPQAGETNVHLNGKYTSQEVFQGRNHARINFDGTLKTTDQGKAKQAGDFSLSDKSTLSGVVFFDLERGIISLSVSNARLEVLIGEEKVNFEQKISTKLTAIHDVRRAIPLEEDAALNKE